MHQELQAGLPLVTNTAKHVANQVPIAGLFGSNDVNSSYSNFHQLNAKDIDGNEVKFADLEGKVGHHANLQLENGSSQMHKQTQIKDAMCLARLYPITSLHMFSRCKVQLAFCKRRRLTLSFNAQDVEVLHFCECPVTARQTSLWHQIASCVPVAPSVTAIS